MSAPTAAIEFDLPETVVATTPAERRGSGRDDVRLMVAHRFVDHVEHRSFRDLPHLLAPGDALVVNTSATVASSLDAWSEGGEPVRVHFASPMPGGLWAVELRTPGPHGATKPGPDWAPQTLQLEGGASLRLLTRHSVSRRLWLAEPGGVTDMTSHLERFGSPIRYTGGEPLPLSDYQTVFGIDPGSAEMPSAARPFTAELVTRLVAGGVLVLPLTLHAGLSSFEEHEWPGEERYRVPGPTASVINSVRGWGGRVIAVGTTVVRALETVGDDAGLVHPGHGITDTVVTPERGLRVVDGLITGWHEPRSSHLQMLAAFVGRARLSSIYTEALAERYLWHEFGDLLLLIP